MKVVSTLQAQDWMNAPETRAVMDALGSAGQTGKAMFVGGCVRNALLGVAVEDIDIATALSPQIVIERLEAAAIKALPTGIDYGTVTAVSGGKAFEITTLRKDVETDGRRAVVAYTDDWVQDARRRDFTMNTLLMDMTGQVFDPLGHGLDDLRARRVVFVGNAAGRIAEDHLRILRYFRFHALYGSGEMDQGALSACAAAADKIPALSHERITQEFFKILSVDKPANILETMFKNRVLKEISKEGYDVDLLRHICKFQRDYNLRFLAARLYALAGLKRENIPALEQFLLIPKVFKKDIEAIAGVLALPDLSDEMAVKVAIYKFGRMPTAQSLMIELAQDRVINAYAPKALEIVQKWDVPNFPVTGEDLIKQGFESGPELGAELERLENQWIGRGFKNDS